MTGFSALQRAEIAEIFEYPDLETAAEQYVSVLFNEPKLLKFTKSSGLNETVYVVSVLFNEPKLLKC